MKSNLIELLKENPDLPIFAWVDNEVVGGDDCGRWSGQFGEAEIREYTKVEPYGYNDQTIVFKNDTEDYYECLLDKYIDLDGEELERKVNSTFDKLKYKKAIFVNVDLPYNL